MRASQYEIHLAAEAWSNISSYTLFSIWNKITMEVPEFTTSEDGDEKEFTLKNWLDWLAADERRSNPRILQRGESTCRGASRGSNPHSACLAHF